MSRYVRVAVFVFLLCWSCKPGRGAQAATHLGPAKQAYMQGMTLVKAGHLDKALREFQRGLALDPTDPALLNAIGATFSINGDLAAAGEYFEKGLQVDPSFTPARRNLAIDYFRSSRFDLAAIQFEKLLDDPGSRSTASLFLGMIAEKRGEFSKSADLLGQAGSLVWQFPEAILAYGHALLELKQTEKAAEVFAHLNQAPGVTATEYFSEGSMLLRSGKNEKALAAFDAAGRLDPRLPSLSYQRALALERIGRTLEALKELKAAVARKPDGDSLNLLAQIAEQTGRLRLAIESYRKAAMLEPQKEASYLGYGTLCFNYKNYLLALKIVNIGLSHIPDSYRLLVEKGAILDELGRQDEAVSVLRQASKLQKNNSVALLSLSICLAHERKFQEAVDTLKSAIRQFPRNYYMHYYLGTVLVKMIDHHNPNPAMAAEADAQLHDAIRLNPSYADSYFQLAKIYLHNKPKLAESDLLTCLRKDPQHASAKYVLGQLYLSTGRRKEGQKLIDQFRAQQEAHKRKEQKTPRIELSQR